MIIPNKHSGYQAGIRLYPKKGGSSAPPPDPRLVQAQIESMGYQNQAVNQVMNMSERLLPYQEEQMRFGLETGRTAYAQSQADRTYALGRRDQLTGFQDKAINDARTYSSKDYENQQAAKGLADVNSAAANARAQQARDMSRRGVNPGSTKFQQAGNQLAIQQTAMGAQAANMARTAARDLGLRYDDRASGLLAGYPSMGMAATGSGAGFGASGITMANAGASGMNAGYGMAGNMAGQMGSNATGMYNAQANYKNGQDQIAASNDPFNTILGAATGVGMNWALGKVF
jgi:hypothetical protein